MHRKFWKQNFHVFFLCHFEVEEKLISLFILLLHLNVLHVYTQPRSHVFVCCSVETSQLKTSSG